MAKRYGKEFENDFFGCHDRPTDGGRIFFPRYSPYAAVLHRIVTDQSNPKTIERTGWHPYRPTKGRGALLFSLISGNFTGDQMGLFNALDTELDCLHRQDGFILVTRSPLLVSSFDLTVRPPERKSGAHADIIIRPSDLTNDCIEDFAKMVTERIKLQLRERHMAGVGDRRLQKLRRVFGREDAE